MRFRYVLLAVALLAGAVGTDAAADLPPIGEWQIPPAVTVTPDGSFACHMVIIANSVPVPDVPVDVIFSPAAAALVAFTEPVPVGADVPVVETDGTTTFTRITDANGEVDFHIAGAGCVANKSGTTEPFIVQVRADNIVLAEPVVNSPDAVDADGILPEELGYSICDQATSSTSVGLADALFHTAAVKQGLEEICTDFTDDDNPAVGLADAGILTPYVREGTSGSCVYSGP